MMEKTVTLSLLEVMFTTGFIKIILIIWSPILILIFARLIGRKIREFLYVENNEYYE